MGDAPEVRETSQQRAFAEIAAKRFADFRQRWLPLQRQLMADVQDMGRADSAERREAAGDVAADTAVQFAQAKGALEGALSESGAGAGSGKFKTAVAGMGDDEATSKGLGMAAADSAIDDAYLQGLSQIASMGRGQSGSAVRGMGDVAAMSGRQAQQDAQFSLADRAGRMQQFGQLAGAGLAAAMQPGAPTNRVVSQQDLASWSPSAPIGNATFDGRP
jgi:hypothetical protein